MRNRQLGEEPEYRRNRNNVAKQQERTNRHNDIIAAAAGISAIADRISRTQEAIRKQTEIIEKARKHREITTIVALFVAAGVALAGAGVASWGIVQAHRDTHKALNDARITAGQQHADTLTALAKTDDTIAALNAQVVETRRLANTAGDTEKRQLRAYISASEVHVFPTTDKNGGNLHWWIFAMWQNSGQTPTRRLSFTTDCITIREDDPVRVVDRSIASEGNRDAPPKAALSAGSCSLSTSQIVKQLSQGLVGGIRSTVEYYDIFGDWHQSQQCTTVKFIGDYMVANPDVQRVIGICSKNCEDEECNDHK